MTNSRLNIWQLQARRDVPGLIDALVYPDSDVRKRAAVALRTIDAVQAVPALKNALRVERDSQVRADMAATLHVLDQHTDIAGLVQTKDIHGLIRALKGRNPDHVCAAARALGQAGDRLAVEPLVILFQNPSSSPRVRLAAAEALLELKSAPAVVTLLGALRRDSWQVRRNAAAVLGQIQATWAVEPLAAAIDDPHPVVRRTAAAALRRIGTADAIAALRSHFAEPVSVAPPDEVAPPAAPPAIPRPARPQPQPESEPAATLPLPHDNGRNTVDLPSVAVQTVTVRDTQPLEPVPRAQHSMPESDPAEPRTRLTQPVMKLIAFLKKRAADGA